MSYSDADKKNHIEEVQQYLRGISYKDSRIPRIIPDGIYGPETRNAVRIFQKVHNLPVTGTVDEQSSNKIYDEYTRHIILNEYIDSIKPFTGVNCLLKPGDTGYTVFIVQSMLNTIAQFFANISLVEITGRIDGPTQNTIGQLQAVMRQKKTGSIHFNTWNGLARLYNIYVKDADASPPVIP